MGNKEQKIKAEVDKTIDVLKNIESIDANVFLFTRIKAEIESPSDEKRSINSVLIEKLLPALLFILIILNTVSLTYYLKSIENDKVSRTDYVSTFAKQYSLTPSANDYSINLFKGE